MQPHSSPLPLHHSHHRTAVQTRHAAPATGRLSRWSGGAGADAETRAGGAIHKIQDKTP
jgi:hypothetical protein